jgi:hypothetical protein
LNFIYSIYILYIILFYTVNYVSLDIFSSSAGTHSGQRFFEFFSNVSLFKWHCVEWKKRWIEFILKKKIENSILRMKITKIERNVKHLSCLNESSQTIKLISARQSFHNYTNKDQLWNE